MARTHDNNQNPMQTKVKSCFAPTQPTNQSIRMMAFSMCSRYFTLANDSSISFRTFFLLCCSCCCYSDYLPIFLPLSIRRNLIMTLLSSLYSVRSGKGKGKCKPLDFIVTTQIYSTNMVWGKKKWALIIAQPFSIHSEYYAFQVKIFRRNLWNSKKRNVEISFQLMIPMIGTVKVNFHCEFLMGTWCPPPHLNTHNTHKTYTNATFFSPYPIPLDDLHAMI